MKKDPRTIHPGEILKEEFMRPRNWSVLRLSRATKMSFKRAALLVKCQLPIDILTARRLARAFGTSAKLWMGLQEEYELRKDMIRIKKEADKSAQNLTEFQNLIGYGCHP